MLVLPSKKKKGKKDSKPVLHALGLLRRTFFFPHFFFFCFGFACTVYPAVSQLRRERKEKSNAISSLTKKKVEEKENKTDKALTRFPCVDLSHFLSPSVSAYVVSLQAQRTERYSLSTYSLVVVAVVAVNRSTLLMYDGAALKVFVIN